MNFFFRCVFDYVAVEELEIICKKKNMKNNSESIYRPIGYFFEVRNF